MKNISLIRTLLLFCITSILSINSFSQTTNQKSNITLVSSWNAGSGMIYSNSMLYTFTFPTSQPKLETYEGFIKLINETKNSSLLPNFEEYNPFVGLLIDEPEQLNDSLSRCFVWVYNIKKDAPLNEKKMKSKNKICSPFLSKKCFILDECCESFLLFSDELDRLRSAQYYKFNKIQEIDFLNKEKKKYDDEIKVIKYENQTVLEFLKNNIISNQIIDSISKKGVVLPSLMQNVGFKFQGVITPEIEGVLQVYDDKDNFSFERLKMEFVIRNGVITSIRIIESRYKPYNLTYGDIVINIADTVVVKTLDWYGFKNDNVYNTLIFNEFKVLNSDAFTSLLLKLKNIKFHISLQSKNRTCEQWQTDFVEPITARISLHRYKANVIKTNRTRSNVINEININDLLKRKTWITYTDNSNKVLPYNYSNIAVTDSSFVIERIGDVENKKYVERFILDRISFSEYIYKNKIFESGFSEHIIIAQKNKSSYREKPSYCIHNPLITKWNRTGQDNIQLNMFIDGKKLLEGNVDNNGNLKGWCSYYAVNAKVFQNRFYDTLKSKTINGVLFSSSQLKSLTTFKYCLSAMDVSSSYNKQSYNAQFDLKFWDPMPFESIYLNIFPDFSPLSISPLGKFDATNKLFVDKTEDYLSQRAYFSSVGTSEYKGEKYGTLKVLYQYLPDGQIYDSVNTNKNEFGEQLGKSTLKPFPLGKEYLVLMKKEQNDIEELKIKSMQGMLKQLNTCDHCGTEILAGKKITTHDFKCTNGKNYILDDLFGRKFCSPKCYSEYQKAWCDMQ